MPGVAKMLEKEARTMAKVEMLGAERTLAKAAETGQAKPRLLRPRVVTGAKVAMIRAPLVKAIPKAPKTTVAPSEKQQANPEETPGEKLHRKATMPGDHPRKPARMQIHLAKPLAKLLSIAKLVLV